MEITFFFSSRRRHTRYWRDWSSDVCSSDLEETGALTRTLRRGRGVLLPEQIELPRAFDGLGTAAGQQLGVDVVEIGRASCREREKISVVAVSLKKKQGVPLSLSCYFILPT